MIYVFRLLARLKFLRGTAFDPFGYTLERKAERKLIEDYLGMIDQHVPTLKRGQIPILAKN
jgi:indolepyruvate ferredoxin oxidoreductase